MTRRTNKTTGSLGRLPRRAAAWFWILTAAAIGCASLAAPARAADPKIGFINIKKAVATTSEFKRTKAAFDQDFAKEKESIGERESEVKKLFEELNKQGFVLSPELKKQKEQNFLQKKKALERYVQDQNEEFSRREREITERITRRMLDVLKTLGKERKFTLIIEMGATFYFDNALDITDLAVTTYDKIHK